MAAAGHLDFRRHRDQHGMVLALEGELDFASSPWFERELSVLETAETGRILVDLSGLGFIDCSGLSVLLRAQRSSDANGQRLVFRRGRRRGQPDRLLQLTGLTDRFTFVK